ncbi:hypothetical protein FNV43_RR11083 [Rhamnella rubrinervis]|uniref:Uncharacterized protein n=1 Tax=Rhamnella rubrinervis TaxID=2594499 RepID=A0A8K0H4X2_9ROSA|nr:hypothetical protein FNV43_RR11083 [Rhamnella rubrinervis]
MRMTWSLIAGLSGSMPYAYIHYPFENVELFEKNFPGHFVAEGLIRLVDGCSLPRMMHNNINKCIGSALSKDNTTSLWNIWSEYLLVHSPTEGLLVVAEPYGRWYSTISINYQTLKIKLFSKEGGMMWLPHWRPTQLKKTCCLLLMVSMRSRIDAGGDAEPPLKRARTTIIHEGGDAYHSSTQELPHQNVHHFEDASSRQLQLIQLDVATLKKQFNEHQLYGESSEVYHSTLMQGEDVIYHSLIVKDVDMEKNEDVNKEEDVNKKENTKEDDTHKHAKDGDVHV